MSVLTAKEKELFDWVVAAMPEWYTDDEKVREFLGAAAKIMGAARLTVEDWLGRQTALLTADGPTATNPDFLGQHAIDRGTSRQLGEVDAALLLRLRNVADMLTRSSILAAVTELLVRAGISAPPAMLELPRDAAYLGGYASETGTGGTFAGLAGGLATFSPTVPFRGLPFLPVFPQLTRKLVISGAASGGNNGTFTTTGVVGNGAKYANGGVVPGLDAGAAWTLQKLDYQGNVVDGHKKTYASRGYRVGSRLAVIIVILPYGTTVAVAAAVAETIRLKKGAGIVAVVERRAVP